MIGFFVGLFIGMALGVAVMALMAARGKDDDYDAT